MTTSGAAVFPGQGSQRVGMAMDFCEQFPESRRIFDEASEALSLDIAAICREDDPRLNMTEFTQPCIVTAEIAMFEALTKHFGFAPEYFGGHSLGEYTALVAAGVLPFGAAVKIVRERGRLMQEKAPAGMGAMAAIIREGLPREEIENRAAALEVDVANDNSPTQVVVSGERSRVETLCQELSAAHADASLRVVPLNVSAPFHSRHMQAVEQAFGEFLRASVEKLDSSKAPRVTSNFTGTFHTSAREDLIQALTRQISGRVRWRDNMASLLDKATPIFELGPNRPLGGFFKALGHPIQSIIDVKTAQRALGSTSE